MPSTLWQCYIVYTKTDSECIVSDSTGARCFWTQYFGSIWSLVPVARCWRLSICWWYGGSVCCFSWPGYIQCIMHMYLCMYSCTHGWWVSKCTFMHSHASACGACLKTLPSSIEFLALKLPSALWSSKIASSGCIKLRLFFPIHFESSDNEHFHPGSSRVFLLLLTLAGTLAGTWHSCRFWAWT